MHDPLASAELAKRFYDIDLVDWEDVKDLDVMVLAVPHSFYRDRAPEELLSLVKPDGIFMDVKSVLTATDVPDGVCYWSL